MSRFAGPGESPGFVLWHATMRWQRLMTSTLAPLGLTHVQFVLLATAWWLQTHDEPQTQVRLAAQVGTEVTMTSDVVGRLEAKGLVVRVAHPTDARAKVVTVTDEGAALAARAIEAVEAADAQFFAGVDTRALLPALTTLAALR
ncbi:MarR family winged helix-turn-helix transcriptional regulator [Cellulomonas alba]|uniref:MarR family winged helix-turn-helix transcriptional regulator n=1 Tax=Cellulomonas alba TaxID=3053467 RepID=A0ABT7SF87_9CELL|nr:MarR family winged helix-turn-helix transcriptional regulator [Cellulomonas alba]MDM7854858.1 MarR family winged helix-turn-helix transcriptional regulator [Cellulomonas alba]